MKTRYKIHGPPFETALEKACLKRTELAKMVGVTPSWIYQLCVLGHNRGCSSSLKYKILTALSHRGVSVRNFDIFYPVYSDVF